MNLRKTVPVAGGFFTIALLSSVFARIQGAFGPLANDWLGQAVIHQSAIPFVAIKLLGLFLSCSLGGIVSTRLGGRRKASLLVGIITCLMIGWLWIHTVHPIGFWVLLLLGVIPSVWAGYRLTTQTS